LGVINSPGSELADDAHLYIANVISGVKKAPGGFEFQQLINAMLTRICREAFYKNRSFTIQIFPRYQLDQEYSFMLAKFSGLY
jgi:hypothetical protein